MNEEIKKSINKGRLNKVGLGFAIGGISVISYLIFSGGSNEENVKHYMSEDSTAIAQNQIIKNKKNSNTLLYQDFVTIKGKKYQIRLNNDRFEVLKDDKWVPIEDVVGQEGTIVLQNGKLMLITPDGKMIALDTGDIVSQDGVLKQVDDDGNLSDFYNDRLYLKNGTLKYVDDDGKEKNITEDDVINLDGKAYKMTSGVLKDMGQTFKHFTAQRDPKTGKLKFARVGLHGDLIPINEKDIPNGAKVEMDDSEYEYLSGNLIPKPKYYTAKKDKDGNIKFYDKDGNEVPISKLKDGDIITLDGKKYRWENGKLHLIPTKMKSVEDVNSMGFCDYVIQNNKGDPNFYKKGENNWLHISQKNVPNKAIIYYQGKPYIKDKSGKLLSFKIEKGEAFIKGCKAYTVGSDNKLISLNNGDIIDNNGEYFIVDDGSIDLLTNDNVRLHDKNKGLAFVNGKPYLLGKGGKKKAVTNDNIVYRGGKPYRYVNGKFIPLTLAEVNALIKIENKNQKEKQKLKPGENEEVKLDSNNIGVNEKVNQSTFSDAWFSVLSADASVATIKPHKKPENVKENNNSNQDFTNDLINKLGSEQTEYQLQNGQAQKQDFLDKNKKNGVVPTDDMFQKSPFTLLAGSIMDATLTTGVNTDQPGIVIAQISRNVYDTKTGNYLLIPQGTRVQGVYNSEVTEGAETVLMVWNKLILPDGKQISLNGLPGLDLSGMSGITGVVDNHWDSLAKAVVGMSVFSAGIQFGAGMTTTGGDSLNALQLVAASISQQLGQLGIQVFQRVLNRQPTISLPMGRSIKIGITHNIVLSNSYRWGKTISLINKGSYTNKKQIQNNERYL